MKAIICGVGNIGSYLYEELEKLSPEVYDPAYFDTLKSVENSYDIAFICVPTDLTSERCCDISIVCDCFQKIKADLFVIKSVVPPGTGKLLSAKYNKAVVISPEYYGLSQHSKREMDFLILGGNKKDCAVVAQYYAMVKPASFRIIYTSWEAAELCKYMLNCFLAMKVTFCNEFAKVAESIGVIYPELKELFIQDERVGSSHTWVYPDQPYYNNHCFNKDIPAFLSFCRSIGVSVPLMTEVDKINKMLKEGNQ
jgi:UDP-glucose 6-dehydrogenase